MLGYRKKSFADAHAHLSKLRANLADFATLKALQQLLCREIVRTEKKIRDLKAERKAVMKAGGQRAGRRSSSYWVESRKSATVLTFGAVSVTPSLFCTWTSSRSNNATTAPSMPVQSRPQDFSRINPAWRRRLHG